MVKGRRAYNVRFYLGYAGLVVEVWRHGRPWIDHRRVTSASWNRLLYVLKGHGVSLTPYCIRNSGEAETLDALWYLDGWLLAQAPGGA